MGNLSEELMAKLNVETVFTIPIFGGIPVPESVVVTWVIMAILVVAAILLTRNLKVIPTGKRQILLEFAVEKLNGFFEGILGEAGKKYVPYLATVALYIGCANLIGLLGFKPPTKDLNVTAALALMSIVLIEYSGLRRKGVKGFFKSFAQPMAIMVPMNILELGIRPLSLCMRLFGKEIGSVVVKEMNKIIVTAVVPVPLRGLFEIFDGLIQTYVFVFLTSLFMKEAME